MSDEPELFLVAVGMGLVLFGTIVSAWDRAGAALVLVLAVVLIVTGGVMSWKEHR